MAALITGLGYIGTALAERLLAEGQRVVGLENGFSSLGSSVAALAKRHGFTLVRGSVNSERSIARAFAIEAVDVVYHLAAQASASPQAAPPSYTEATNLVAPRRLFEAAATHRASRWVYGSSFRVYGDELRGTIDERAPYGQISDLSHLSKVYAEKLIEMLAAQHGAGAANLRLGVVYGLGPTMKTDARFLTVPNLFCLRAARGETLAVHPGAIRPIGFIHLDDAVEALIVAGRRCERPGARAYNAVAEVLTVGEVADIVASQARQRGLTVRVEGAAAAPAERWRVASGLDSSGFAPRRSMSESLGEVLEHYLARSIR